MNQKPHYKHTQNLTRLNPKTMKTLSFLLITFLAINMNAQNEKPVQEQEPMTASVTISLPMMGQIKMQDLKKEEQEAIKPLMVVKGKLIQADRSEAAVLAVAMTDKKEMQRMPLQ